MAMIRHPKDFYAGLLFVGFGVAAIVIGSNYPLGTAARMGPGYFPRMLGILLIVLGAALSLAALRCRARRCRVELAADQHRAGQRRRFSALIVTHAGLVLSTIGLIVVAERGEPRIPARGSRCSAASLLAALAGRRVRDRPEAAAADLARQRLTAADGRSSATLRSASASR